MLRSRNSSTTPPQLQLQLPSLSCSNNISIITRKPHISHIKNNSMSGINRNRLKQSFLNNVNNTYTTYTNTNDTHCVGWNNQQRTKFISSRNNNNNNNHNKEHIMFNCISQSTQSPECVAVISKKNETMHKVRNLLKRNKNMTIKCNRPLIQIIKDLKDAKAYLDKNRNQKIVQYFKHAITHKVHPKSMDMIYKLEHSRDNIHLQKLILNVEYKKEVIDKNKDTSFTDDNERVNYVLNQKVFEEVKNRIKNNKHKRSNSQHSRNNITPVCKASSSNIHSIKATNHVQSSSSLNLRMQVHKTKRTDETCMNVVHKKKRTRIRNVSDGCIVLKEKECCSQGTQDIERFNNEEFAERYMNISKVVDSEMNMHYKNQVLKTEDIDIIRQSKYDILLQKLKDDYIDKYNTFKEYQIGKDIQKRHQEKLIRNNIVIRKVGFKKRHDVNFLMPRTEEQNDKLKHKLSKAIDDHKKKRNIKLPFKINIEFFEPQTQSN